MFEEFSNFVPGLGLTSQKELSKDFFFDTLYRGPYAVYGKIDNNVFRSKFDGKQFLFEEFSNFVRGLGLTSLKDLSKVCFFFFCLPFPEFVG